MPDFKAKMQPIRFRLGLRPRPITALPRPPCWIWTSLRGRGSGWAGEEEGKMEGKGREGKVEGREREAQVTVETRPSET